MRRILSCFVALCLVFVFVGCDLSGQPEKQTQKKEYTLKQTYYTDVFDTIFTFYAFTDTQEEFDALAEDVHTKLKEYHELYDIYNEYEEMNNLRTINLHAGKEPVQVDSRIIELLEYCKEMTEKTNGYVDCTYGRVLSIWHQFIELANEEDPIISVPNEDDLKEALTHHGWENIQIDKEKQTVYIRDPMLLLNVGAIAKGYAAERVKQYLKDKNLVYTALNVGGNVTTISGKGEKDNPWIVGIANPEKFVEEEYLLRLNIIGKSVITSGDYERFYIADEQRFCHIIDLKTGYPAKSVRAVSVITSDSGWGDALSTALFIMPLEEGKKYVEALKDVEAVWVLQDNSTVFSSGFKNYIKE